MQNYEKSSEMQNKSSLLFSFPRRSNFGDSQNYEKSSEMQNKKKEIHINEDCADKIIIVPLHSKSK